MTSIDLSAESQCTADFVPAHPETLSLILLGQGTVVETSTRFRCSTPTTDTQTLCTADFESGQLITLHPQPAPGYHLNAWSGCDDNLGSAGCVVLVDSGLTGSVIAEFVDNSVAYDLAVTVNGGGRVDSNPAGIACGADCSEAYTWGTSVALTATADPGNIFSGWGGDCTGEAANTSVTVDLDRNCTALFNPIGTMSQYILNTAVLLDGQPPQAGQSPGEVLSTPEGADCGNTGDDCSEVYDNGTIVRLMARPGPDFVFDGWTSSDPASACALTSADRVDVLMDANRDCTAQFVTAGSQVATLTTEVSVDGATPGPGDPLGGNILSVPAGIDCGSSASDCIEGYVTGTTVLLTATADPGYRFYQWSDDCSGTPDTTAVAMNTDAHCVAEFVTVGQPGMHTLDVQVNGGGRVDSNPAGIACGTDCTENYALNSTVTLVASGTPASPFQSWTGDCMGGINTTVIMDTDKTCTANFVPAAGNVRLTINVVGAGRVTTGEGGISCPGDCVEDYPLNTNVPVLAVPDAGNQLYSWSDDCFDLGSITNFQLNMFGDRTCTATFGP